MRESIRGFADALIEQLSADRELGPVAGELHAVHGLLLQSEDLRRNLSDPGLAAHVRRSVVEDLFAARVQPATLRLVVFPIAVDRATEYVGDVAWLAERFDAARDARQPLGEVVLGRSAAGERIEGYATAVLETVAESGRLTDIEDELFRFMRLVDGAAELKQALSSRDLPAEARRSLVVDLLGSRATAATTRLAAYATQVGRPRDYVEHLVLLVERVAAESNRRLAEVRAAVDLDDNQRRRLADVLGRLTGRSVEVRVTVDRSVLGGFVATIGDTVVDGSARHRLDLLKERLVLPEATITTTGEPS